MAEDSKPKRGSIIRRKRVGSVKGKSTKELTNNQRSGSEPLCGTDVSILVTEPSPEAPTPTDSTKTSTTNEVSTVVQVLVHRESEEYNQEEEEEMQSVGAGDNSSTVVIVEGDEEVTLTVMPPPQDVINIGEKHQDS